MASNLGLENSGGEMAKASMGMTISRKSAPAGVVSFKTTNISKEMIHELVFVRYPEPGKATPLAIAT